MIYADICLLKIVDICQIIINRGKIVFLKILPQFKKVRVKISYRLRRNVLCG